MARVWAESRHSGSELLMLLAIADFADDEGNAYPSVPTLALKCRMTPRNANRTLAALRASGALEIRMNEGPRGTNRYRVVLEGMTCASPLTPASPRRPRPEPLTPTSSPPDAGVPKPLTPASDEPSMNHQRTTREPSGERARARKPSKTSIPDGFAISDRVRTWAGEQGFGNLDQHLEAFVGKALANGYRYADWDAAFRNAVRDDWAGLRSNGAARSGHQASRSAWRSQPPSGMDITHIDYREGLPCEQDR